jgi:hypothetical protein
MYREEKIGKRGVHENPRDERPFIIHLPGLPIRLTGHRSALAESMLDYLIVGAFVLVAAAYLVVHFRSARRKASCDKCNEA